MILESSEIINYLELGLSNQESITQISPLVRHLCSLISQQTHPTQHTHSDGELHSLRSEDRSRSDVSGVGMARYAARHSGHPGGPATQIPPEARLHHL